MNIKHLILGLSLTAGTGIQAQIFPVPQTITTSGTAFRSSGASFKLTGAESADADAVAALNRALTVSTTSGAVELIIGEAGDDAVSAIADKIPSQAQGYYLSVTPTTVTIAGRDGEGTYYGVQSFLQLMEQQDVPQAEVTDWPVTSVRGVIEGYYGNPWSHEDCLDMFEFFDRVKMNTFIYGPKNDAYHKAQWADPYPEEQGRLLSELAVEGLRHKVHFTWAMHPGNEIRGDNMKKALDKFNLMYDLGIRRFAVFFDDINAESVTAQVEYLNYLNRELVKAKPDVAPLIVCPSEYCISFAGGWNTSSTYLETLGNGLDADIEIMWTGAGVVDMNQKDAAEWFTRKTGRKPFIWLNYPVTDYGYEGGPLLMSPYEAAATELHTLTTAFCANPMEYYEASKIALMGIGDFTWNPESYDAWNSWEKATAYVMPEHVDAFRTYCYSNFYYPSNTHGLVVAYEETPEFKALTDAHPSHSADFNPYFEKQLASADELLALEDNRLVSEIKEWIEVYRMQAERGLLLDSLRRDLEDTDGEAFVRHYRTYTALTDSAAGHYSRDGWPVRKFLPKSAPQYVEPFIKNAAIAYAETFRAAGYDYPSDLFPPQLLADGNYYILYNGKLLSNGSGAAADTPGNPTFRNDIDDINSARQSWKIHYNLNNGRYSIRSAFDDRYVNELGNFGTNVYEDIWHTYEITCLGDLFAIRNAGSAGNNYWTTNATRISKGTSTGYDPANFMFSLIPVSEEITDATGFEQTDYRICDEKGRVLTRNGNNLSFQESSEADEATQKWKFELDTTSKRFKITQGTRFINEKGVISTNPYYSDWNSYELYNSGNKFAIRNADSAGTNFWTITENNTISNAGIALDDAYLFILEKVTDEESSITEINDTATDTDEVIYDLQGRRVARPGRGIHIVNGKKILF